MTATNFLDGGNDTPATLRIKRDAWIWFWRRGARCICVEANYSKWIVDLLAVVPGGAWAGVHVVEVKVTRSDFKKDAVTDTDVQKFHRDTKEIKGLVKCLQTSLMREARIRCGGKPFEHPYYWMSFSSAPTWMSRQEAEDNVWQWDTQFMRGMEVYDRIKHILDGRRPPKIKFLDPDFTSDFLWIAAPGGMIKKKEVPPGFGLLEHSSHGCRMAVRAPRIEQEDDIFFRTADAYAEIARKNTYKLIQAIGGSIIPGDCIIPMEDGDV